MEAEGRDGQNGNGNAASAKAFTDAACFFEPTLTAQRLGWEEASLPIAGGTFSTASGAAGGFADGAIGRGQGAVGVASRRGHDCAVGEGDGAVGIVHGSPHDSPVGERDGAVGVAAEVIHECAVGQSEGVVGMESGRREAVFGHNEGRQHHGTGPAGGGLRGGSDDGDNGKRGEQEGHAEGEGGEDVFHRGVFLAGCAVNRRDGVSSAAYR